MAKRRKMPARYKSGPKKGQFKPRGSSTRKRKRKNTTAKRTRRTTARRAAPKRTRRRRRNPPKMKPVKKLTQGGKDAAAIVVGKAAARFIPTQFNLPKQGALGLAVQAGVALLAGMAAERVGGKEVGRMVLAGGLTAPIETFVVANRVPFLSGALSPVTATAELGAYAGGRRRRVGTGLYAQPIPNGGMGRYAQVGDGMGSYDHAAASAMM